jgi:hypothetical protein
MPKKLGSETLEQALKLLAEKLPSERHVAGIRP